MTPASRRDEDRVASLSGDRASGATTALTLVVAFGLLALGVESFWVAFPAGFGVVLPTALGLAARCWPADTGRERDEGPRTAPEELRLQYARGELTGAEFERRVGRLLEDGDVE